MGDSEPGCACVFPRALLAAGADPVGEGLMSGQLCFAFFFFFLKIYNRDSTGSQMAWPGSKPKPGARSFIWSSRMSGRAQTVGPSAAFPRPLAGANEVALMGSWRCRWRLYLCCCGLGLEEPAFLMSPQVPPVFLVHEPQGERQRS